GDRVQHQGEREQRSRPSRLRPARTRPPHRRIEHGGQQEENQYNAHPPSLPCQRRADRNAPPARRAGTTPMLDSLSQRLARVVKTMRGEARLTEANTQEMLREIRIALLEADVALPVVRDFIARVKEKALGTEVLQSLTPGQALVGEVHKTLTELMGGASRGLDLSAAPPAVVLMAGLQGSGKTSTVGKLAKWLRENQKKKV